MGKKNSFCYSLNKDIENNLKEMKKREKKIRRRFKRYVAKVT